MRLYLLRHGIAEATALEGDDGTRRLTATGRSRMRAEAVGMRALGLAFDVILTSPLARAVETAAIVAAAYPKGPKPQTVPELAAGIPPPETLRALRPFLRRRHVLAVGHEPGLGRLASLILTGSSEGIAVELKKGSLLAVELNSPRPGTGTMLRFLLSPKQLRRLGG
jgi:phosphohistidine phosphatase